MGHHTPDLIPVSTVEDLMREHGIPGAIVGVTHGSSEQVAGFGVTSNENPLPVNQSTLAQIGSITKTFTASAAMRLVDAGALNLDEPVRTYLPGLLLSDEHVAARVTMRHLLSHVGGWTGDYFDDPSSGDDALELIVSRLDRLEQLTPLGQTWAYNNAGFYIAGRVLEVLTGEPFEKAVASLVLRPLGLEMSFFRADDVLTHRFMVGHDREGAVTRPWGMGRAIAPLGGLVTTASDLLRYARAQWKDDGFLSERARQEMRTPHIVAHHGLSTAAALGWYVFERDDHAFLNHGGNTLGQRARLVLCPASEFAVTVLANSDAGTPLQSAVIAEVLTERLGIDPLPLPSVLDCEPDVIREYVGTYESPGLTLVVEMAENELLLNQVRRGGFPTPSSPPLPNPPALPLAFSAPDVVVVGDGADGASADFIRGGDGAIAWFRFAGRLFRRAS